MNISKFLLFLFVVVSLMVLPIEAQQPRIEIHWFVGSEQSYQTNAYWIESKDGIVLIDSLMLKKDANQLATVMKTTGKPLVAIILTHPHVDHFGGTRVIVDAFGGKVPVIATKATAQSVKKVHENAIATWAKALGDSYEQDVFVPNQLIKSGEIIELAGMRLKIQDYGAMESDNNSIIEFMDIKVLFTGDATVSHAPFYVGEGHSTNAIEQLEKLAKDFAPNTIVYSGHNEPNRLAYVVKENINQIKFMQNEVKTALSDPKNLDKDGQLNKEAKVKIVTNIAKHFDQEGLTAYGLNQLILASLNLPGLEQEFVKDK